MSRAVDYSGQPRGQLGEKDHNGQPDDLNQHKGYDAPVDVAGGYLRRGDRLQVKQGKTKGRRQKRSLQVHRQKDAEPDGIIAKLDHDGRQDRHMDKGNFNEIEKEAD